MDAATIQTMIAGGLPDAKVEVSGDDGAHFEALIVDQGFSGKPLLQRHRMVYATLGDAMRADIHALTMQTLTPEEWQARRS